MIGEVDEEGVCGIVCVVFLWSLVGYVDFFLVDGVGEVCVIVLCSCVVLSFGGILVVYVFIVVFDLVRNLSLLVVWWGLVSWRCRCIVLWLMCMGV